MPKLRGIDTRGRSMTECLEKIRDQINTGIGGNPFELAEDFSLACELGYGQFIWQSANYLRDESPAAPSSESSAEPGLQAADAVAEAGAAGKVSLQQDSPSGSGTDADISAPPASFMSDDPERNAKGTPKGKKAKR